MSKKQIVTRTNWSQGSDLIVVTATVTNLAKRKLDNLGHIKAHSGLANDPVMVGRMKRAIILAEALSRVSKVEKEYTARKKESYFIESLAVLEDARRKFVQKRGDVSKLTKLEISSLLLRFFSTEVENIATAKKAEIVENYNVVFQQNPDLSSGKGARARKSK